MYCMTCNVLGVVVNVYIYNIHTAVCSKHYIYIIYTHTYTDINIAQFIQSLIYPHIDYTVYSMVYNVTD